MLRYAVLLQIMMHCIHIYSFAWLDILQILTATNFAAPLESTIANLFFCSSAMAMYDSRQSEIFCQNGGAKVVIRFMQKLLTERTDEHHMDAV